MWLWWRSIALCSNSIFLPGPQKHCLLFIFTPFIFIEQRWFNFNFRFVLTKRRHRKNIALFGGGGAVWGLFSFFPALLCLAWPSLPTLLLPTSDKETMFSNLLSVFFYFSFIFVMCSWYIFHFLLLVYVAFPLLPIDKEIVPFSLYANFWSLLDEFFIFFPLFRFYI